MKKLNRLCSGQGQIWRFSTLNGESLRSDWSDLARSRTCMRFYGYPHYLQVWRRSNQKWSCYPPDNIFHIISAILGQHFPHFKSMGDFVCHGNQSFYPICPKTLCCLSPTQMMLQIKFEQDLSTGLKRYSSLKVWTTDDNDDRLMADHWYTISSPCEPLTQGS